MHSTQNTQKLDNSMWTVEQEKYLEWLSLPRELRIPKSKSDMADKLGVHRRTLYSWEAKPEFNSTRLHKTTTSFVSDTPDILNALRKKAVAGNISAIRLWLDKVDRIPENFDAHIHEDNSSEGVRLLRELLGSRD